MKGYLIFRSVKYEGEDIMSDVCFKDKEVARENLIDIVLGYDTPFKIDRETGRYNLQGTSSDVSFYMKEVEIQ